MIVIVVQMVIQHSQASHREAIPVRQEKGSRGMLVKWIPLKVQAAALIAFQCRDPLWNIPVYSEWQVEKIPNLFPVGKVDLDNLHKLTGRGTRSRAPTVVYTSFSAFFCAARVANWARRDLISLSTKNSAPKYRKKHSTQAEMQTVMIANCLLCAA